MSDLSVSGDQFNAREYSVSGLVRSGFVRRGARSFAKEVFDRLFAACALLALAPLLLAVALVILVTDGGPVFFGHERVGRDGRPFRCWKFRTMRRDADTALRAVLTRDPVLRAEWEATRKLTDDPRITRVGRFLRRTSLDELPQFWNVLTGSMSVVGPRPIVRQELLRFEGHRADYIEMKPGITGMWQVSGRSDTSYEERIEMDVAYVRAHDLWTDMVIVARTVRVVLAQAGAR